MKDHVKCVYNDSGIFVPLTFSRRRQVSVYASLHAQVDNQKKICDGTAEMLKNAQSEMVAKTGIVVESNRL